MGWLLLLVAGLLILVLGSVVFFLITAVNLLVASPSAALALGLDGWLRLGAAVTGFVGFGTFVLVSQLGEWFGVLRRPIHALCFSAWLCASAFLFAAPVSSLPVFFFIGLPIGYFAEWWIHGI